MVSCLEPVSFQRNAQPTGKSTQFGVRLGAEHSRDLP